jgi:hypothetical protein
MRRLITVIALAAIASTFAIIPVAASADRNDHMGHQRCPRGSHWVAPHRNKQGTWVVGHCSRH